MPSPDPTFRVATEEDYRGAHSTAPSGSVISGQNYRLTVLTSALLRIEWSELGLFEDRASTFAIFRDLPTPRFTCSRSASGLRIQTDNFDLLYDEGPLTTSGLQVQVRGDVTAHQSTWRYDDDSSLPAWELQSKHAHRVPASRNFGGTARTLDEANGPVPLDAGVASELGYAVIDDSRSMVFTEEGWFAPRRVDDKKRSQDLYIFTHGLDFAAAVADLYRISGTQPTLPRWALGNWWSRFHRYTTESYLALHDRFAAAELPFSVAVIDMDWHVTDVDPKYGPGWTGYSWNRELFPDPEEFLSALHERGLRVTLNVHPADGVQPYEDAYLVMAKAMGVDPESDQSVVFDATDPEFMAAYLELLHRPLEDEGVDFWWLDWQSGKHSRVPGIDPLWVLNHLHSMDSARDGDAPLILSRYAGPGSHRYPVGFSGDTHITWESLEFQPYFTATAANIGYGWWSHDIGGHMFGYRDDELMARWSQFGVFSPIMRLHSSSSDFQGKEPWQFEAPFRQALEEALRLRNRLVPYLHSMNLTLPGSGTPLVQPLYHRHGDPAARRHPNAYFFGTQLLVAAITEPIDAVSRCASTSSWLPSGIWYDVFTGYRYQGGRELTLHRRIDSIPVLMPAGAVLPLADVMADADGLPSHLSILIAGGAPSSFELVEDAEDGSLMRTRIEMNPDTGEVTIQPCEGNIAGLPHSRDFTLEFLGCGELTDHQLSGSGNIVEKVQVDATRQRVKIVGVDPSSGTRLRVTGLNVSSPNPVSEKLEEFLGTARIGFDLKEAIVSSIEQHGVQALAELATLDTSSIGGTPEPYSRPHPAVISVLTELLLADPKELHP